jgi:hypothetical protein
MDGAQTRPRPTRTPLLAPLTRTHHIHTTYTTQHTASPPTPRGRIGVGQSNPSLTTSTRSPLDDQLVTRKHREPAINRCRLAPSGTVRRGYAVFGGWCSSAVWCCSLRSKLRSSGGRAASCVVAETCSHGGASAPMPSPSAARSLAAASSSLRRKDAGHRKGCGRIWVALSTSQWGRGIRGVAYGIRRAR